MLLKKIATTILTIAPCQPMTMLTGLATTKHLPATITKCLVTQLCPTLCSPMDCSPPGFSVHGILQSRIPEWVGCGPTTGSSQPRNLSPNSLPNREKDPSGVGGMMDNSTFSHLAASAAKVNYVSSKLIKRKKLYKMKMASFLFDKSEHL